MFLWRNESEKQGLLRVDAPYNWQDNLFSVKSRPLLERIRAQEEKDEVMAALEQFRKPRDALLILVSEYVRRCSPRVQELRRILPPRLSAPELLDSASITVSWGLLLNAFFLLFFLLVFPYFCHSVVCLKPRLELSLGSTLWAALISSNILLTGWTEKRFSHSLVFVYIWGRDKLNCSK